MKITELLRAEHLAFLKVLASIEKEIDHLRTVNELRLLARITAEFLHQHGETEDNVLYPALNHLYAEVEGAPIAQMVFEHQELDEAMRQVQEIPDLGSAKTHFHRLLLAIREHFQFEESEIFPHAEKILQPASLQQLATATRQLKQYPELVVSSPAIHPQENASRLQPVP